MGAERPVAGAILEVAGLSLGPIGTNCYVLNEAGSSACVVVDPGDEAHRILAMLEERELTLDAILVTHCHWDHIGAVADLAAATGTPVWMSAVEATALEHPEQFQMPGMPTVAAWPVEHRLEGGERIEVAGIALDVLSVPGHSPGHLAFVTPGIVDAAGEGHDVPPICCIGDVIFQGSVGRTDLPFADGAQLQRTLRMLSTRLHPDTVLLSGHGGVTTMRDELATNPFLQGI